MVKSKVQRLLEEAKKYDPYWVEKAKIDFSVAMERQRKSSGMTYKDIADKIATSAAYITKVFRGDSNLTIESMVKLARAAGGKIDIRIVDEKAKATTQTVTDWNNGAKLVLVNFPKKATTTANAISVSSEECADQYQQLKAA